jgi:hypothetical protein
LHLIDSTLLKILDPRLCRTIFVFPKMEASTSD